MSCLCFTWTPGQRLLAKTNLCQPCNIRIIKILLSFFAFAGAFHSKKHPCLSSATFSYLLFIKKRHTAVCFFHSLCCKLDHCPVSQADGINKLEAALAKLFQYHKTCLCQSSITVITNVMRHGTSSGPTHKENQSKAAVPNLGSQDLRSKWDVHKNLRNYFVPSYCREPLYTDTFLCRQQ